MFLFDFCFLFFVFWVVGFPHLSLCFVYVFVFEKVLFFFLVMVEIGIYRHPK